jgi:hypothetical protein
VSDSDVRQEMLDEIGAAIEETGRAVAALLAAYEEVDEQTGDRLEAELFRPAQLAYGRAQRTHAAFAERYRLPGTQFVPAPPPRATAGARELLDDATEAATVADGILSELQDSLRPIEHGDPQLRAGLAEVRTLLADVTGRARGFVRVLGR